MFIAAWVTITKAWKKTKYPSTDEWIKKMWYTYIMEYYSAIKNNEIMPFTETWMDQEIIILSEVRQRKTNIIYHLYVESLTWHKWIYLQNRNRLTDIESRSPIVKNLDSILINVSLISSGFCSHYSYLFFSDATLIEFSYCPPKKGQT